MYVQSCPIGRTADVVFCIFYTLREYSRYTEVSNRPQFS